LLRYTLAFLRKGDRILMINREKNPWRGAWNGIGGKIEAGETPAACVVREIREETGIRGVSPLFRGVVTWNPDGEPPQGMYVFIADVTGSGPATPQRTREGILEWKSVDWLLDTENYGTVPTLRVFMKDALDPSGCAPAEYHCTFAGKKIVQTQIRLLKKQITTGASAEKR
jgi:8-oxo-dGTP diphosphatase